MTRRIGKKTIAAVAAAAVLAAAVFAGFQAGVLPGTRAEAATEVQRFELVARSDVLNIGDGVTFEGFTFDGTMPGPQKVVQQGDRVEVILHNEDSVAHGLSLHAINGQTSKYLGNVEPGETARLEFVAEHPGVFMYHCAPGGHGIMAHTMGGQHGMFVVEPNQPFQMEQDLGREPDLKIYIVQHEVYKDGRDFFDGKAQYVMFNGETFRYVRDPIQARPGDYVRFYYLNVGPNLTSTFHAVGGVWDYIYYGGVPENKMRGTQSVVSGPTDSYVIEWQVPEEEGQYTLVTHAFGTQAIKGAVGILEATEGAERDAIVRSEGPNTEPLQNPKRHVAPFGLGSEDLDRSVRYLPGQNPIYVEMVGNSFVPKRLEVPVGSKVTFVNEDVFDMLEGELTGKHDAVVVEGDGDEWFATELLDHAETESVTFDEPGTYEYICSIHPYMRASITVYETDQVAGLRAPASGAQQLAEVVSDGAPAPVLAESTAGGPVAGAARPSPAKSFNGRQGFAPAIESVVHTAALRQQVSEVVQQTAPQRSADEIEARRGDIRESFGLERTHQIASAEDLEEMQMCH